MPPLSEKELEDRLRAAGNSLVQPPSSSDELFPLLDRVEELLSKVEQSPAKSMQNALSPLMNALVAKELLKHLDIDVKVGVASCISEITRITAPDAPYDDDKMKDVFDLIVSSFENLSDTSSRSYEKRISILETVAKVRSCVIMLDLECDQMIIDMFNHFLKTIRDYHEEAIFMSMVTIMTLVLEESEDISADLLNTMLTILKRNNEEVLPIAKKLAERVIHTCAEKLKPYLTQTLKTLDVSPDTYSGVVASTCEVNSGTGRHSDENTSKDQKVADDGIVETTSQDKETSVNVSPKLVESNGINEIENEETMTDANYSIKTDSNQQSDDLEAQEPEKLEAKVVRVSKRKGKQFNSKNPSTESSDLPDDKKQAEQVPTCQEIPGEDGSLKEVLDVEASQSLDDVKDCDVQVSQSESLENEGANVASPTESPKIPDENKPKKVGRPKKKEKLVREETAPDDCASEKASEGTDVPKANNLSLKKKSNKIISKNKSSTEKVSTNNDGVDTGDSETKLQDQTQKTEDSGNKMEDESLSKKRRGKKSAQTKPSVREGEDLIASPKSPVKLTKDEDDLEETPMMKSKIKRSPGTEKTTETTEYDENLVDSKVRVWWPKDQMFYEGVITSYDSVKKKHTVLYSDGDKEVLNLRRERWEFIEDDSVSDMGQAVEHSSHAASSDLKRKKKGDINSETSSKRRKMEGSPKSEPKSSGKLKYTKTKLGGKSGGKADSKSKSNIKSSEKSEDGDIQYEDHSPKPRGKSHEGSGKASGKSRDVDVGKTLSQSKQESQRLAKSKGKTQQGSTSRANGTGMAKSSSSKVKETNQSKEKPLDLAKSEETIKGKSPDTTKSRESTFKSGKKRRR